MWYINAVGYLWLKRCYFDEKISSEKCAISAMFMWLLDCGRNVVNVVHKKEHKNLTFTLNQMWLTCGFCMASDNSLNHINMVDTP